MTELFESTMDNVSGLEVKGYSDPVKMERTMEIWVKRGDEEYLYKFTGPGVRVVNIPMVDDCLDLAKKNEKLIFEKEMLKQENENLKKDLKEIQEAFPMTANKILYGEGELKVENEDTDRVDKVLVDVGRFDSLLKENEKLNARIGNLVQQNTKLKEENEALLEGDHHFIRKQLSEALMENKKLKEAYEKLCEENKQLKETIKKLEQADMLDKEAADYWSKEHDTLLKRFRKLQKDIPGQPITNPILVDNYNMMLEDNEKLKNENKKLKDNYKMLGKEFDKVNKLLNYRDEQLEKLKKELSLEKDANEAQHKNTRADILDQAKKCVCGQREQDYGTPESNFQLIADLWNGYLGFMDHPQDQIRATDVAMMMALLKIARIRNGGGSGDSFVDLAGYAACGGEIWDGERH